MAILFAGLFAFISACIIVVNEYMDFQKEIAHVEESYVEAQKKSASSQMKLLNNIVSHRYHQSKALPDEAIYELLKEDVRYLMSDIEGQNTIFIQKRSGEMLYRSNTSSSHDANEILFTTEYPPLDLVLGSSVSMSSMADVLAQKKSDYEDKIISFILKIYMLTLFLYLVSTIEYRYVSDIMGREIRFIVESFKEASKSYEVIDVQKINFTDTSLNNEKGIYFIAIDKH